MPDVFQLLNAGTTPKAAAALNALRGALLDVLHNDANTGHRVAAAQALAQLSDRLSPAQIIPALADDSSRVRYEVVVLLRTIADEQVLTAFAQHLDDAAPLVRQQVLEALVEHRANPVTVVPSLIKLLGDINPAVRMNAAQALGRTNSPQAVQALLPHLQDADSRVSLAAAEALGALGNTNAAQPLFALASNELTYYRLRVAALHALAKIDPPEIDTMLFRLLRQPDLELRRMVIETIGQVTTDAQVNALLDAADWHRSLVRPVADALVRCGGQTVEAGMNVALGHVREWMRALAVEVLGELRSEAAVPGIVALLAHDTQQVRVLAANALGQIGDERAVEALQGTLGDPEWLVQAAASSALARIDTPQARAASADWRAAQRNGNTQLDLDGDEPADVDLSDIL